MGCVVMEDARSITPTPPLPDDPAALKSLIATLVRRVGVLEVNERKLAARAQELELGKQELELAKLRLEMQLLRFKKWMYGPRADKLTTLDDVAQMLLGFG